MAAAAEIELEEAPHAADAPQPDIHSDAPPNQEECVVLVSGKQHNHMHAHDKHSCHLNRQQLAKSGEDRLDDGDVGVPTKHTGLPGTTVNFINSILGAGIIGLPGALQKSGFIFGLFLIIVIAMMIDYGVRHLVQCGLKVRRSSYETTMQYAYGTKGFYTASIAICLFAYGAMIVYHIVIGDTIPPIFQTLYPDSVLTYRPLVVILYSVIFMLPLSLLKNMASLDKTSALSVTAVIVIVILVSVEAPRVSNYHDLSALKANHLIINQEWFAGAGTISFAFVCHHSSFVVYHSLRDHTPKRWNITTRLAIGISVFFSMWLAIVGFFCFQTETQGDILNNFAYDNPVINFARALLALTMVFTYPMEMFVARYSILQCLKLAKVVNTSNENMYFYSVTVALWLSSLLIGAFIAKIGVVLELVGDICGALVGYILPGVISLRIFGFHSLKDKFMAAYRERTNCHERYIAGWNFLFPIFMILFGFVIMIMGIVEISLKA